MSEELLTSLANSRVSFLKYVSMSPYDFRLDYQSNFSQLSYQVGDVLDKLTNHSVCHVVWLSYLVAADMVDMLLRVAAVATREIDISCYGTIDAVVLRLMVRAILPEMMLYEYSNNEGERMLGNEWNLFLKNLTSDELDRYNYSHQTARDRPIVAITEQQLDEKVRSVNAHSQQFHHKAGEYSCQDHLNIYQYPGSPAPSQLSNPNPLETRNYSDSVGSPVVPYVYVGPDVLTNDVTHVSVHSLAKVIDSQAFMNCMKLKTVQCSIGLIFIKEGAFQGCTKLVHVTLPDGLSSIENCAFNGCSSLKSIAIPSSIIHLGQSSFKDCTQLEEVIINDVFDLGLRNILDETFSGCTSLRSVNIPSSVMDISLSAFSGCDNPSLLLIYPPEIIDFISGYNILWWNLCSIDYQVYAYSFIQSRNVINRLRVFEERSLATSLAHVLDLFSQRIQVFNTRGRSQSEQQASFRDDIRLVDTLMTYYEHIHGIEENSSLALLPETGLTLIRSFLTRSPTPSRLDG